jgi:hypothetical protein
MMRRLGFRGAIDHGTGTIHPNEPIQAVFFDPGSIRILDVIHNDKPPQMTRGQGVYFSKWSRNPEGYTKKIIDEILEQIGVVERLGDFQLDYQDSQLLAKTLKHISSLVGWMNTNVGESLSWNRSAKQQVANQLDAALRNIKADPTTRYIAYGNRIVQTLRRG